MSSPWIILDRDGVINIDSDDYIKSTEEWQPIPGSIEAIAELKQAGFLVAVVTNQSGLARGLFSLDDLEAMHQKMQALVEAKGGCIDAIFYCPHAPQDNCSCRKPKTGLLNALEAEMEITVENTWLVGDSIKDLQLAQLKQCKPILVLTGKGKRTKEHLSTYDTLIDTPVFENLQGFVNALLEGKLT